ncbi:MAG: hypothetical protein GC134_02720 [Proteobacteria bacterium]|nr:hypothetical protein [Pseudomonadota bacterium]
MRKQLYEPFSQHDLSASTQKELYGMLGDEQSVVIYDVSGDSERTLTVSRRRFGIRQTDGSYKEYHGLNLNLSRRPYEGPAFSDCRTTDDARKQAAELHTSREHHIKADGRTMDILNESEKHVEERQERLHENIRTRVFTTRRDLPDNLRKVLDAMQPNNGQHISIYHEGMEGNQRVFYTADIGTGNNSHLSVGKVTPEQNVVLIDPATGKFAEDVHNPEELEYHLRNRVPNELALTLHEAKQARLDVLRQPPEQQAESEHQR